MQNTLKTKRYYDIAYVYRSKRTNQDKIVKCLLAEQRTWKRLLNSVISN